MKRFRIGALAATIGLTTAWGHHSHSNYDMLEYTRLTGTVVEMRWMNPHTWIYLEVPGEDGPSLWALEGGSPNALTNNGWGSDSLQPGDEISVRCHRLRDGGSSSCLLGFVTFPGGEEMRGFIQRQ